MHAFVPLVVFESWREKIQINRLAIGYTASLCPFPRTRYSECVQREGRVEIPLLSLSLSLCLSVSLSRKYIVRRNGKQDPLPIANMECATGALCVCVNRWDDARGYRMRELHNYAWRIKELVKRTVCVYLCADWMGIYVEAFFFFFFATLLFK